MRGTSAYVKGIVLYAIRVYQKTLSFDHGPLAKFFPFLGCRFYPSCSNYTHDAILRFGIIRGGIMGAKRVLRCHPGSHGGHDPVPEKKEQ
jgi:putative membrane protein insertion efficiency factor